MTIKKMAQFAVVSRLARDILAFLTICLTFLFFARTMQKINMWVIALIDMRKSNNGGGQLYAGLLLLALV
jgi:hypothetical protein